MSVTHGLAGTYRNQRYACRCPDCCRANTERLRVERAARVRRLAADPTLAPHGKASTYQNWGCRCEPCTAANSAELAGWRRRTDHGRRKP